MGIFDKATKLQRQGDWAGYGEELRKLEQVLKRMAQYQPMEYGTVWF